MSVKNGAVCAYEAKSEPKQGGQRVENSGTARCMVQHYCYGVSMASSSQ